MTRGMTPRRYSSPLTGDLKRRQAMLQLYAQALPSAQASAATERNKQPEYSSRYKRRW